MARKPSPPPEAVTPEGAPRPAINASYFQPATLIEAGRELFGTLATRGWRPFLTWGMTFVLILLGLAFVRRFDAGTISAADFIAVIPIAAPLMQQLFYRHREVTAAPAPQTWAPAA